MLENGLKSLTLNLKINPNRAMDMTTKDVNRQFLKEAIATASKYMKN